MTKIGLIEIENVSWDQLKEGILQMLDKKGKDKADKEADHCEWYESDAKDISGSKILTRYIPFRFITRKRIEEVDKLTDEVYRRFTFNDRELAIAQSDFFEEDGKLYLIFSEGSSEAVSDLSKFINSNFSIRRKISFNEDFLEYLNTSESNDPKYSKVFKHDMSSVRRKGSHMKHILDEKYPVPGDREQNINMQFREAAGVKITPPTNLTSNLPTMDVTLFRSSWISLSQPSFEDSATVFYESVIYCYKRISDAYSAYIN